jgi:hypothetical protein
MTYLQWERVQAFSQSTNISRLTDLLKRIHYILSKCYFAINTGEIRRTDKTAKIATPIISGQEEVSTNVSIVYLIG